MQDKDKVAFENWAQSEGFKILHIPRFGLFHKKSPYQTIELYYLFKAWQAAIAHRNVKLPTCAEIAEIITSMLLEYPANACVPIQRQGHEIAYRIHARLKDGAECDLSHNSPRAECDLSHNSPRAECDLSHNSPRSACDESEKFGL